MKKLDTFTTLVNIKKEKAAVNACVAKYWDIEDTEKLSTIVDTIVSYVENTFGDVLYSYVGNRVHDFQEIRENNILQHLVEDNTNIGGYKSVTYMGGFASGDDTYSLLNGMWFALSDYNDATREKVGYYDKDHVAALNLKHHFLPKGYASFIENYEDYQGMQALNEKILKEEFKGHVVKTYSAGSLELPVRIQLPHVAYDDIAQGRTPEYSLVGAIMGHFIGIIVHNNTVKFLKEIGNIDLMAPVSFNNLTAPTTTFMAKVWEYVPSFITEYPVTEQRITDALTHRFNNLAKSKEELKAEHARHMKELLDEVLDRC